MKHLVQLEIIEQKILMIRGHRVMLDRDLAELYEVSTKALNQAVKRNLESFPEDFMFALNEGEKKEVVTICDHLAVIKYSPQLPYAFTEQGVAMLSSVLKSKRARQVNVQIMRAFVKLRQLLNTHKELARKLEELEKKYDAQFKSVFDAIKMLMAPPAEPDPGHRKIIGFKPEK
ncbi:MAG TPA: DNA-binding protein [Elusimicrobia bacterium]|nr:DNA-binding protein [Elusimicrobiota bacterium]